MVGRLPLNIVPYTEFHEAQFWARYFSICTLVAHDGLQLHQYAVTSVRYNEAKTRNLLKFAGVPQTRQPISAVNGPKFIIL